MNRCIIVDKQDRVIGHKSRDALTHEDIHRVSALWLTDRLSGECLITKRKHTKSKNPGKWNTAVTGTVENDEGYLTCLIRETMEELGIASLEYTPGPKQYIDDGRHRFFCQWYYAQVDKTTLRLILQAEEVAAARWLPIRELLADIQSNPEKYTPSAPESLAVLGIA